MSESVAWIAEALLNNLRVRTEHGHVGPSPADQWAAENAFDSHIKNILADLKRQRGRVVEH